MSWSLAGIGPASEGLSLAGDPYVDSRTVVLASAGELSTPTSAIEPASAMQKGAESIAISTVASGVRDFTFILIAVR